VLRRGVREVKGREREKKGGDTDESNSWPLRK
jgi:hypothetical protein